MSGWTGDTGSVSKPLDPCDLGKAVAREILRRIDSRKIVASDVEIDGPAWAGRSMGTVTRFRITVENGLEVLLTRTTGDAVKTFWVELLDPPTQLAGEFSSDPSSTAAHAIKAIEELVEPPLSARRQTAWSALGLE